ncbi:hypothetical protein HPO96_01955 [Kribbella sandramycini]|uniref:Uncharacterized protein n=1 Tax=Kribbella sandramycini TaxID=60450 RepID=A0A7Y4KUK8_9ACTN|nr:hypothetical protein [Kribbella sandramycini]MBB6568408.1 hypothetical protein [Kribbella sandramycini]NOL39000.1 hypothetical protein [Kribbella sandramycini]
MKFHLIVHDDFKQDMVRLHAAWQRDPTSPEGLEFQAAVAGLKALREGREDAYVGKQLGSGPRSYDLRDCAELKVPVVAEWTSHGRPLGPSHRLVYREFEPLPTVEGGRVVHDPAATPYRHAVAFAHRADDPASIAGERLGRQRSVLDRDLYGLTGGGRPSVGPDGREGAQTTPHRIPVPGDLLRQAAILRDSPPPTPRPPGGEPGAAARHPGGPGQQRER